MKRSLGFIAAGLALCAGLAYGNTYWQLREGWRSVYEAHILMEADRAGVVTSNVQLRVDVTRRNVTLAGTVANPRDIRRLYDIIEASGMNVDASRLTAGAMPTNWPALVCTPAPTLSDSRQRTAAQAISNYLALVNAYDAHPRPVRADDAAFARIWRALLQMESAFLDSSNYVVESVHEPQRAPDLQSVNTNTLYQDATEIMRRYRSR